MNAVAFAVVVVVVVDDDDDDDVNVVLVVIMPFWGQGESPRPLLDSDSFSIEPKDMSILESRTMGLNEAKVSLVWLWSNLAIGLLVYTSSSYSRRSLVSMRTAAVVSENGISAGVFLSFTRNDGIRTRAPFFSTVPSISDSPSKPPSSSEKSFVSLSVAEEAKIEVENS